MLGTGGETKLTPTKHIHCVFVLYYQHFHLYGVSPGAGINAYPCLRLSLVAIIIIFAT